MEMLKKSLTGVHGSACRAHKTPMYGRICMGVLDRRNGIDAPVGWNTKDALE
jgi:hypothetical protein